MAFNPDALEGIEYIQVSDFDIERMRDRIRYLSKEDAEIIIQKMRKIIESDNIKESLVDNVIFLIKLALILGLI